MNPKVNGVHSVNALGRVTRVVALGYYDGPTDGVIEFSGDRVFRFAMPDEENQLSSGRAVRKYDLSPLRSGSMDELVATLSPFFIPTWPVWFPTWKFPSQRDEESVEERVGAILEEAGEVEWSVATSCCHTFEDYQATRSTTEGLAR
jgi:hypothetical protein